MEFLEIGNWLAAAGPYGVLLWLVWLMLRGELVPRAAVENIVKLLLNGMEEPIRKAVRDGFMEAQIDLSKRE